ncbi:MAG: SRPBCC domain-containing protein [Acidimicrobiia bacterium]
MPEDQPSPQPHQPPGEQRSLELEIEVPGSPEQVWQAIATGPGISSWYVPHVFEEHEGASAMASFGPGPEMQIPGRVAAWEPPSRIVFDGGEGAGGMAFEWTIEARDGGTCIVRLVNSGFGVGEEWDGQYDAMREGWGLFLRNLVLHLTHFAGQSAASMLPMGMCAKGRDTAWADLTAALGIPAAPAIGSRVVLNPTGTPSMAGVVADTGPRNIALVLDQPAPGTAIVAAEGDDANTGLSIWSYLYGPDGKAAVQRDEPQWQQWLGEHAAPAVDGEH